MADKKKVGVLIEGDFYEKEIFYYEHRFAEEGIELHFLSRLWGQPARPSPATNGRCRSRSARASRTCRRGAAQLLGDHRARRASCRIACATPTT